MTADGYKPDCCLNGQIKHIFKQLPKVVLD